MHTIERAEHFCDDLGKSKKDYRWYVLGCCIVAFILGFSLVIPVFDRKTLLSHLQTYLEGDVDKNMPALGAGWQDNNTGLGWELLDGGAVFHMWNKYNDYYFNATNGIQFSNHYNEYWTRNVLMLGYYDGDEWNLLYRTDELSGFNHDIHNVSEEINVTLWKDLNYGSYDFRLALHYHLGANDFDLTIIPYIKNLGIEIPYVLGFGWELKDIKIANVTNDNYARIYNGTDYEMILLNQTLDRSFTDMDLNTSINLICTNPPSPYLSKNLYLSWNENLTYKATVKSRANQYNAPTTLFIRVGALAVGQEKFTEMHWLDADDWLGISSAELDSQCHAGDGGHLLTEALDGTDYWSHAVNEIHWFVIDLGQTYTIKKVRGRSQWFSDPIDVNIYIDDSNPPTTLIHEGITTWQDTNDWVEIDITDSDGRYIKVEIEDTENAENWINFGDTSPTPTIFDAYGDVAAVGRSWQVVPTMLCNFSFSNTTDMNNIPSMLCNFSFSNTTATEPVHDMTCNFSFSNVAIMQNVPSMYCNFSFSNTTTTDNIPSMFCNFSFSNTTTTRNIGSMFCNFSFSNTAVFGQNVGTMYCNFSFSNTTTMANIPLMYCNFSFSNTTDMTNIPTMYCNFSFSNRSVITITNPYPANESTDIPLQIIAYATITNTEGNTMTLRFYYGNSTANATTQLGATQSGLGNGTYNQLFYPATNYSTTYYWRVYVNDGSDFVNNTFHFTTTTTPGGGVTSRSVIGIIGVVGLIGLIGGLIYNRRKRRRYEGL